MDAHDVMQACFWKDGDAHAFTEMLLDRSPFHGVIFIDADEVIQGWNRGACHITGFTAHDVIGQPAAVLFTPEDRERGLADHELRIARDAGVAEDERWHLRKDGSRFWSGGHTMAFRDKDGTLTGYVKAFRDATHLRTRMKALENLAQEARVTQDRNDLFLGAIAHELRNPLAPLKSALQILQFDSARTNNDRSALQVMARQLVALEHMIEDIVDLTRVKSGKLRITYEPVVLQPLIEEAVDACRQTAGERGIRLHALLPKVPLEVEVDRGRLHQVIANLLGNALKFTPRGGAVWVTLTADQTHFVLILKDDGEGISPALLPQIFDAFTQASDAPIARGAGIGLGLTVVKEIAALHQGTVEVRSEGEGKGSEFTVRIPLKQPVGAAPEPMPRPL